MASAAACVSIAAEKQTNADTLIMSNKLCVDSGEGMNTSLLEIPTQPPDNLYHKTNVWPILRMDILGH